MTDAHQPSDNNDGDVYLVDSIVDRRVRRGRVEYRVRWKGFSPDQDSWEPFTNLKEPCLPLIQDFHNRFRKDIQEKRRLTMPTVVSNSRTKVTGRSSDSVSVKLEDIKPGGNHSVSTNTSMLSTSSQHSSKSSRKKSSFSNTSGRLSPALDVMQDPVSDDSSYTGSISINPAGIAVSPSRDIVLGLSSVNSSVYGVDELRDCSNALSPETPGFSKKRALLKDADVHLQRISPNTSFSTSPSKAKSSDLSLKSTPTDTSTKQNSRVSTASHEAAEHGRKSVTIMLKASPTHEFLCTKELKAHHLSETHPSRSKVVQNDDVSCATAVKTKKSAYGVPDSHIAKVMDVVLQLKSARRRPLKNDVLSICNRRYNLSEQAVIAALNLLVSNKQLHEIPCVSGISYRLNSTSVARGDLTAKIKAKYTANLNKNARQSSVFAKRLQHTAADTNNHGQKFNSTVATAKKSSAKSSVKQITKSTKPHNLTYRYKSKGASFRSSDHVPFERFQADIARTKASIQPHAANDLEFLPNRFQSDQVAHPTTDISMTPEPRFEVPAFLNEGKRQSDSKVPSVRPRDAVYKFKSILVRKNITGGFTELWIQSPSSPLKNTLTVQVLEELTTALNQAATDNSRLVMISGMGTVFSCGIDLISLIGRLPDQFLIPSVSSQSSSSSSVSSSGDGLGVNNGKNTESTTSINSIANSARPRSVEDSSRPVSVEPSIAQQMCTALRLFLLALASVPKPVVAGVNGPALGLAVAMLPLCDLVYISDSATLQLNYNCLGQTPEGGASYTFSTLIGVHLANELLLAGRKITAREAVQFGLASDLLLPKNFKQELIMRCHKIASNCPAVMEMTKSIIRSQHRERIASAVEMECRTLNELWLTDRFRQNAVKVLTHCMGDFL